MPFAHQFFGVPFLSFVGRVKYGVNIKDFHCGLRGVDKNAVRKLSFHTLGMEFATEIIAVFAKAKLPISQVNIRFRKDMRNGKSHLRTIRDGMRHLIYIVFN